MHGAGGDLGDFLACQGFDEGGFLDIRLVFTSEGGETGLAERVEAPGVDLVVLGDGKGMVGARVDGSDFVLGQAEFAWLEAVVVLAFNNAATELVLLSGAPGEDVAFFVEGEDVVGTGSEGGDVLDVGNLDRGVLDEFVRIEAENAFIILGGRLVRSGMLEQT